MRVTISVLQKMRQEDYRITMLTCTDASFAALLDAAGVDILLVGDSLGMTVQGHDSTLPVTMEDMIYHTNIVARKTQRALVLGDMPFGSYQQSTEKASPVGLAIDKNQPAYLAWLRQVAGQMKPRLDADEMRIIEQSP